jgi:hypothetical protein
VKTVDLISDPTVAKSRLAERLPLEPGTPAVVSLARLQVETTEARAWRVTLGRADRKDQFALNTGAGIHTLLFTSPNYPYCPGAIVGAPVPPVRANRIGVGPGGSDTDPFRVELAWGMAEGGAKKLIAHWPMQGASLTVYGSYVEVFASGFLGYAAGSTDDVPLLRADIVPGDSADSPGELSIQQEVAFVLATNNTVLYVPEYARSVRTILGAVSNAGVPFAIPTQARLQWTWFDDLGVVCDSHVQGSSINVPAEFMPVPARATLLKITSPGANIDCGEQTWDQGNINVHWRVAP